MPAEDSDNVRVVVRCRPMSAKEKEENRLWYNEYILFILQDMKHR
jgi:hypothetical protein